jgi:hypothetical protein
MAMMLIMLVAVAAPGVARATTSGKAPRVARKLVVPNAKPPVTVLSAVPFFDNLDSYLNGSTIIGQGGWDGWDSNLGANATVTNAQSNSSANSVSIAPSADIVQEFTGATSGKWYAKAQTYVPTGMTGNIWFIVMNTYSSGGAKQWSIQVALSAATVGNYREDLGLDASTSTILDKWVELRAEIDLDANTADIFYNGTLFDTHTYAVGAGVTTVEAFDLYADGTSGGYMDDLYLDSTIPVELSSFQID